jgi:hypothetical protein
VNPTSGERAAAVRARVTDAISELGGLRCADPAAAPAMYAVKLTEQTLACWWLPLLDQALDRDSDR